MNVILCPVSQHPELGDLDDAGLRLFADTLGIDLYRNWDGRPATTLEDAWRIREHLDEQRIRQAAADNARREREAAADEIRLGPMRRKLEAQQRRQDALAAIEAGIPFHDERYAEWEARADERGAALFVAPAPATEPDYRTPIQRLKEKG